MTDLSRKYRIGQLLMRKYRWPGELKKDYVFKILGFWHDGTLADVVLVKIRENGKWTNIHGGREASMWDYEFRTGAAITPKEGWGKVHAFKKG